MALVANSTEHDYHLMDGDVKYVIVKQVGRVPGVTTVPTEVLERLLATDDAVKAWFTPAGGLSRPEVGFVDETDAAAEAAAAAEAKAKADAEAAAAAQAEADAAAAAAAPPPAPDAPAPADATADQPKPESKGAGKGKNK